jgi:hypothetical protein
VAMALAGMTVLVVGLGLVVLGFNHQAEPQGFPWGSLSFRSSRRVYRTSRHRSP